MLPQLPSKKENTYVFLSSLYLSTADTFLTPSPLTSQTIAFTQCRMTFIVSTCQLDLFAVLTLGGDASDDENTPTYHCSVAGADTGVALNPTSLRKVL